MESESDNPFWEFSLSLYGRPGVAEACLALQDRHGLDVNLLLYCCWAGARARRLDAADIVRLVAAVVDWQGAVVRPLRAARRHLKGLAGADDARLADLRSRVKGCELAAERIEQAMLVDALPPRAAETQPPVQQAAHQAECAAANLARYLEVAGVAPAARDRADLEAVV
ncbi:MAG: TIGR02444 family protein, partial [Kiloniellales bacterium]|nr:TIGR02444 family protein [Kiloniellales bacterium]